MEKPKIPHGIASRSTKTHSFNDIDRWVCPVQVFSITSHDQNASLAKQGLSAASPHPIALCRQDCCVPGSRWSASSLRTSRRLSYCGNRTGGPISAWGGRSAFTNVLLGCNGARTHACCPGRSSAQCSIRPIKKRQSRSSSANRFPDRTVCVQDRFLSRRWLDRPSRYIIAPPDRGRRVLAGKRLSRPATRFRNVAATREPALIAIVGRCCSGRRVVRAYLPCNSQARRRAKAAGRLRFWVG